MTFPKVCNSSGIQIHLEQELARGGEGIVYSIRGAPDLVAKLYLNPPDHNQIEKLQALKLINNSSLKKFAALPTELLHSDTSKVIGFIMPRCCGRVIQELYNPKMRLMHFPKAGWKFQVLVAYNLVAAYDEIHKLGCVIGDVNQSHALVSPDTATVMLIDCDSFQINFKNKIYPCFVGTPHFTPPELQILNLGGVIRTTNHDLFGLAVLIYHLLFVGRHPYTGLYSGTDEPSLEKFIAEYRFTQGPMASSWGMRPPPITPTFADIPETLGMLFRRAFERGSDRVDARPNTADWSRELLSLQKSIIQCTSDKGHTYWRGANHCPWCRFATNAGTEYYFGVYHDWKVYRPDPNKLIQVRKRLQEIEKISLDLQLPEYRSNRIYDPNPIPRQIEDLRSNFLQLKTNHEELLNKFKKERSKQELINKIKFDDKQQKLKIELAEYVKNLADKKNELLKQVEEQNSHVTQEITELEIQLDKLETKITCVEQLFEKEKYSKLEECDQQLVHLEDKIRTIKQDIENQLRHSKEQMNCNYQKSLQKLETKLEKMIKMAKRRRLFTILFGVVCFFTVYRLVYKGEPYIILLLLLNNPLMCISFFMILSIIIIGVFKFKSTNYLRKQYVFQKGEDYNKMLQEIETEKKRLEDLLQEQIDNVHEQKNQIQTKKNKITDEVTTPSILELKKQRDEIRFLIEIKKADKYKQIQNELDSIERKISEASKAIQQKLLLYQQELNDNFNAIINPMQAEIKKSDKKMNDTKAKLEADLERELVDRESAFNEANKAFEKLRSDWNEAVKKWQEYEPNIPIIYKAIIELQNLEELFKKDIQKLATEKEPEARMRHLKIHVIHNESIPDFGLKRKQILMDNGIRTAADIVEDQILEIPGFGKALTQTLLNWQARVLDSFSSDWETILTDSDIKSLQVQYQNNEARLIKDLTRLLRDLESKKFQTVNALDHLRQNILSANQVLGQTMKNLEIIKKRYSYFTQD